MFTEGLYFLIVSLEIWDSNSARFVFKLSHYSAFFCWHVVKFDGRDEYHEKPHIAPTLLEHVCVLNGNPYLSMIYYLGYPASGLGGIFGR